MSREFKIDGFKVLWGTIVREEQFDISKFPAIPDGQTEPVYSIPELKPLVDQIIEWGKDFTPRSEINPVVASSWVSAFDPQSTGMNIHTDEDHGGTISAVIWFEGEENQGGDLVLWDPRWENPKLWGGVKGDGKHTIKFKPGTVVMFPSSVWHGVTAYTGTTQRRSVNLVLTFRNVKQLALEEVCTDRLKEIGEQLGYNYTGSLESLSGLIDVLKTKL
jgi:hypothetical protein